MQVGQFKEQFSLEQLTSARFTTFMERSLADAFAPARNLGAQLHYLGPNWTVAGGVFSEGIDDDDEDLEVDSGEGIGTTGRATFAPIMSSNRLVHLGGAISWRAPEDPDEDAGGADQQLRFRQRPESHVADQRLVETGTIENVDDFIRYGAEAALAWGPGSVQGEYIYTDIERSSGALPGSGDLDFDGWYIFGSWFLTGESRAAAYKIEKAAVDRVKPFANFGPSGWGAFEIAARYSALDLSDEDIDGDCAS
ncbi:MAG: OprO/OprP family phosphate-selective porin [Gammaproteobacteria bacterium]